MQNYANVELAFFNYSFIKRFLFHWRGKNVFTRSEKKPLCDVRQGERFEHILRQLVHDFYFCTCNKACLELDCAVKRVISYRLRNIYLQQNASNHDWQLECIVDGEWFHGPSHMTAKAGQTTYYPLMFKPHVECNISGVLNIRNK